MHLLCWRMLAYMCDSMCEALCDTLLYVTLLLLSHCSLQLTRLHTLHSGTQQQLLNCMVHGNGRGHNGTLP